MGDGRPPRAAGASWANWSGAELEVPEPLRIILVGQMAIARFLGAAPLEERIGRTVGKKPVLVPLPHPSGQSRWLNDPANRRRLDRALAQLSRLREDAIG